MKSMFEITNHAEKRIKERFGIKGHKSARSLCFKAYKCGKLPCQKFLDSANNLGKFGFQTYSYKQLDNMVFVFQTKHNDLVCLTVYNLST